MWRDVEIAAQGVKAGIGREAGEKRQEPGRSGEENQLLSPEVLREAGS